MAIDCMPRETREAMLDGITSNRIIVGAYTDREGGVCPMLAAHRHGGRTALASFARAWDRYTNAHGRPRPATGRELRTLTAMLEASLYSEDRRSEMTEAVTALKAAKVRRAREAAVAPPAVATRDTGERDRTQELHKRHGWSWLRVFRRYDAYKAALDEIEAAERQEREQRERELV
ncbi:MAG: hypothetical protein QOJ12_1793 [Thermoleophilales bacterium]|nr:hypothetical protein [Thermoleophilales bacterium]